MLALASSPAGAACLLSMANDDHRFGLILAAGLCSEAEARSTPFPLRVVTAMRAIHHTKDQVAMSIDFIKGAPHAPKPQPPKPDSPHQGAAQPCNPPPPTRSKGGAK